MTKSFSLVDWLNPATVRTSVQALPSVDFWSLRPFVLLGRWLQAPMRIEATAWVFKKSAIMNAGTGESDLVAPATYVL